MRLCRFEVTGLFDRFHHVLDLSNEENISIIIAPNGFGKTVILNLIKDFFSQNFHKISKVHFDFVELGFSNGGRLQIRRQSDRPVRNGGRSPFADLSFSYSNGRQKSLDWKFDSRSLLENFRTSPARYLHFVTQVAEDEWVHDETGESYSSFDLISDYPDYFPDAVKSRKLPEWLNELVGSTDCALIETQRLQRFVRDSRRIGHRRDQKTIKSVVEHQANDLFSRIRETTQSYASKAQELDESFPKRALQVLNDPIPDENLVRDDLKSVSDRRADLVRVSLLSDSISAPITDQDLITEPSVLKILNLHNQDTKQKLNVFEDMYEKIDLFKKLIRSRFNFKKVEADREVGFKIVDDEGRQIPLAALSSGEQHEIVIAYELLFKVPDGSLILIDEPELSLHVVWQKKFLDDLRSIQEIKDIKFLIATHSPQIINDKWDLTIDLSQNFRG